MSTLCFFVLSAALSACSSENIPNNPGEDIPGENIPGENGPGENGPGENIPGGNIPGGNIPGENGPGENVGEPLPLRVEIVSNTFLLTPVELNGTTVRKGGAYSERLATFAVEVVGFGSEADASGVALEISHVDDGLYAQVEARQHGHGSTPTFSLTVQYDGETAFPEGLASIQLSLKNIPEGHSFAQAQTLQFAIVDGQAKERAIPVSKANLQAFNAYANTEEGLKLHYKLTENIKLESVKPGESNWTSIGGHMLSPGKLGTFSGSFDGDGHTLSGLTLYADELSLYDSMFGYLSTDGVVENIGLIDVNITGGLKLGSLVGLNRGTVQNSYAMGSVEGYNFVGGLVGENEGTVQNSYAMVDVEAHMFVGGLLGINNIRGTVKNSHATGRVEGTEKVGGLVGHSDPYTTVQNSYATSHVKGASYIGGLVGMIGDYGTLKNSYATGDVEGIEKVGGLVGENYATLKNSYATGNVRGSENVGGLVGHNGATVQTSYATGNVEGDKHVGGLVGRISTGTVRNNVALNANLMLTADDDTLMGRVAANIVQLSSTVEKNNARYGMKLSYNNGASVYVPTMGPENGVEVGAAAYTAKTFWESVFEDFEGAWEWNSNTNLPILKDLAGKQNHTLKPLLP